MSGGGFLARSESLMGSLLMICAREVVMRRVRSINGFIVFIKYTYVS